MSETPPLRCLLRNPPSPRCFRILRQTRFLNFRSGGPLRCLQGRELSRGRFDEAGTLHRCYNLIFCVLHYMCLTLPCLHLDHRKTTKKPAKEFLFPQSVMLSSPPPGPSHSASYTCVVKLDNCKVPNTMLIAKSS